MEFERFVEKPTVVQAVQWNGTVGGGEFIRDLLMHIHKRAHVKVIWEYVGSNSATNYLKILGWDERKNNNMHKDDWLVWDRVEGFQIISDAVFRRNYTHQENT